MEGLAWHDKETELVPRTSGANEALIKLGRTWMVGLSVKTKILEPRRGRGCSKVRPWNRDRAKTRNAEAREFLPSHTVFS